MTDGRAAFDEDRLPWLEEVEDEDAPSGVSARRMLTALLLVVLAAVIVAGDVLLARPPRFRRRVGRARTDQGAAGPV